MTDEMTNLCALGEDPRPRFGRCVPSRSALPHQSTDVGLFRTRWTAAPLNREHSIRI